MSVEDLQEYSRRIVKAAELVAKAKAKGFQDVGAQAEIAKGMGLSFTKDDVDALAQSQTALSAEQLQNISAGFVSTTAAVVGSAVAGAVASSVGAGAAVAATTGGSGW